MPAWAPSWALHGVSEAERALLLTALLALEGTLVSLLVGRGDFLICSQGHVSGTQALSLGCPSHLDSRQLRRAAWGGKGLRCEGSWENQGGHSAAGDPSPLAPAFPAPLCSLFRA